MHNALVNMTPRGGFSIQEGAPHSEVEPSPAPGQRTCAVASRPRLQRAAETELSVSVSVARDARLAQPCVHFFLGSEIVLNQIERFLVDLDVLV